MTNRTLAVLILLLAAATAVAGSVHDRAAALLPDDVAVVLYAPTVHGLDEALAVGCDLVGEPAHDHAVLLDMIDDPAFADLAARLDPAGPLVLALGTPDPFGTREYALTAVFRTDLTAAEAEAVNAALATHPEVDGRVDDDGLAVLSTAPGYAPGGGTPELLAEPWTGDVGLRVDLAGIFARLRPMIEYGLGGLAAAAAQPSTPEAPGPGLDPAQAAAIAAFARDLMDSAERFGMDAEITSDHVTVRSRFDVAAGSPFDPGPQSGLDRALELTRALPHDADLTQVGCGDYAAITDRVLELQHAVLTASRGADDPDPEVIARWFEAYREGLALAYAPHAAVTDFRPDGMSVLALVAPPDAAGAAAWIADTLDTLPLDAMGITIARRDDAELGGLSAWSWDLSVDAAVGAEALAPAASPGPGGAAEMERMLSALPSRVRLARHRDRLLLGLGGTDADFADLAAAVRRGGGHDDTRVADAARDAGSGAVQVIVGDMAPYLRWLETLAPGAAPAPDDTPVPMRAVNTMAEGRFGTVFEMRRDGVRALGRYLEAMQALEAADSE